ncbi:hypothetical protein [uncultured Rikenella sp.]|uniref:hypothetical protein n=1 Tax=uncultured Rikenella sp. TaxID=368003 RepID=UPI0026130798|nr:hypothetical protein [uncultured Rikenella sp.]
MPLGINGRAPGYRAHTSGGLWSVGSNGHSWATIVSESKSFHLSFNASILLPNSTNYRAYGLQLRCLSE